MVWMMMYGAWIFFGIVIAMAVITGIVGARFKKKAQKNSRIANSAGKTGAQIAMEILQANGINNVRVVRGQEGKDHYNPRNNQIQLSPSVHDSSSVYAAAVAAHEVGHAIQWAKKYVGIKIRDGLAQPVSFVSKTGSIVMMVGLIMFSIASFGWWWGGVTSGDQSMMYDAGGWMLLGGAIAMLATGLFQLVTLPVEFNASKRAKKQLDLLGITRTVPEQKAVAETLRAAAMTYVIAFAMTTMWLIMILLAAKARR